MHLNARSILLNECRQFLRCWPYNPPQKRINPRRLQQFLLNRMCLSQGSAHIIRAHPTVLGDLDLKRFSGIAVKLLLEVRNERAIIIRVRLVLGGCVDSGCTNISYESFLRKPTPTRHSTARQPLHVSAGRTACLVSKESHHVTQQTVVLLIPASDKMLTCCLCESFLSINGLTFAVLQAFMGFESLTHERLLTFSPMRQRIQNERMEDFVRLCVWCCTLCVNANSTIHRIVLTACGSASIGGDFRLTVRSHTVLIKSQPLPQIVPSLGDFGLRSGFLLISLPLPSCLVRSIVIGKLVLIHSGCVPAVLFKISPPSSSVSLPLRSSINGFFYASSTHNLSRCGNLTSSHSFRRILANSRFRLRLCLFEMQAFLNASSPRSCVILLHPLSDNLSRVFDCDLSIRARLGSSLSSFLNSSRITAINNFTGCLNTIFLTRDNSVTAGRFCVLTHPQLCCGGFRRRGSFLHTAALLLIDVHHTIRALYGYQPLRNPSLIRSLLRHKDSHPRRARINSILELLVDCGPAFRHSCRSLNTNSRLNGRISHLLRN